MPSLASASVPRPMTRHSCALVVLKTVIAGVRTTVRTSPKIPQRASWPHILASWSRVWPPRRVAFPMVIRFSFFILSAWWRRGRPRLAVRRAEARERDLRSRERGRERVHGARQPSTHDPGGAPMNNRKPSALARCLVLGRTRSRARLHPLCSRERIRRAISPGRLVLGRCLDFPHGARGRPVAGIAPPRLVRLHRLQPPRRRRRQLRVDDPHGALRLAP